MKPGKRFLLRRIPVLDMELWSALQGGTIVLIVLKCWELIGLFDIIQSVGG